MKKIKRIFALILFILFEVFLAKADAYEPMIYNNGWETLSKKELNTRLNSPVIDPNTGEPLMLKLINQNGEIIERACAPLGCDDFEIYEHTTYDIVKNGIFREVAITLKYYAKAKPSKYSYVRDFTFDQKDPMMVLPVDFVSWVGSDQREFIEGAMKRNKSWRDVSPNARILELQKHKISLYDTFEEDFYKDSDKYTGDRASLSGCHAKIPSARPPSNCLRTNSKIGRPGHLAVLASVNTSTTSKFSFLVNSINSFV